MDSAEASIWTLLLTDLWLPFFFAVIAVPFAAWQYQKQKAADRDHELRKEKRAAFTAFVRGLDRLINHKTLGSNDKEMGAVILEAKQSMNELYLRATPENLTLFVKTMEAAKDLSNYLNDGGEDEGETFLDLSNAFNTALTNAVNASRQEFGITQTDAGDQSIPPDIAAAWILRPDNEFERAVTLAERQLQKTTSSTGELRQNN